MKRALLLGIMTGWLGLAPVGADAGGSLTIREVSRTGGNCVAVKTWVHSSGKEYRIRAIGARVEVLDAAKPGAQPVILGTVTLPGAIGSLDVAGPGDNFASTAIAVLEGGVYMIDLSDPRNPQIPAASHEFYGKYTTVQMDGSKAHVLDETASSVTSYLLQQNAISPVDQIFVTIPTFAADGGTLLAPVGPGFQAFNTATTPMTPGAFFFGYGPPTALGFCNGYAVAGTPFSIDVFHPAGGPPISSLPAALPTRLASNGTDLVFADLSATVNLIDLSNPAMPAPRGTISAASNQMYPPEIRDLHIHDRGNLVKVLCAATRGTMVSSLYSTYLNPSDPVQTFTGGDALHIGVANGMVATAWGDQGLEIAPQTALSAVGGNVIHRERSVRVRHFRAPQQIIGGGNPATAATPFSLAFSAGLGTMVYEVERGASAQIGAIPSADVWDLDVSGSRAVTLEYPAGLRVYDVTSPSTPLLLGTDPSFFTDGRVSLKGNLAAIATSTTLTFLDISNPATPMQAASIPGSFTDVELSGSRAYAGTATGLEIFDVSNPANPTRLGGANHSGTSPVHDIELDRRDIVGDGTKRLVAWLAADEDGVFGFDVEDPTHAVEFLNYDLGGGAKAIDVEGNWMHYADGYNGRGVAELVPMEFARDESSLPAGGPVPAAAAVPKPSVGTSPNPFRETTTISFELPAGAEVAVDVLDVTGRRVASLLRGARASGRESVTWDGRDAGGRRLAAGVYFVQLRAGDATATQKVVRAR
jgi:hypothetical protein